MYIILYHYTVMAINEDTLYDLKATGCSVNLRMYAMCLFNLIIRIDRKDRMIRFHTGNTET